MTAPYVCEHGSRCACADAAESLGRQAAVALNQRNALRAESSRLARELEEARAEGARFKEQRDNAWKDLEHVGNVLGEKIEAGQDFAHAAARVMNLGAERIAAAEARLSEALAVLRDFIALEVNQRATIHRVHAQPFWICVCEAESDSDYPTGKPCTCPRPKAKRGCVDDCPACTFKRERDALVSRARSLLASSSPLPETPAPESAPEAP